MKGENNHNFIKDKKLKECKFCNKLFYNPDKTRKFCCHKCASEYNKGENNPIFNNDLKMIHCPICNKLFRQKRKTNECCSIKCKQLNHSSKVTGIKNPQYSNGRSFGKYCEKFNREFKKRVKLFCNDTCFICGSNNYTVVHHINENKDACCNNDNELNQFIILCRSCHMKLHANKKHNQNIYDEMNNKILFKIKEYNGKTYYTKEEYNKIMIDTN